MFTVAVPCALVAAFAVAPQSSEFLSDAGVHRHETLGISVLRAKVTLPDSGWQLERPIDGLRQLQILLTPDPGARSQRLDRIEGRKRLNQDGREIRWMFAPLREYANLHGGIGPEKWGQLEPEDGWSKDWIANNAERFLLVPGVPIGAENAAQPERMPLIVELQPLYDDGNHWVCFNDGRSERVPFDRALLAKHGVDLSFRRDTEPGTGQRREQELQLFGLLDPNAPGETVVTITSTQGEQRRTKLDLTNLPAADAEVTSQWAYLRSAAWNAATGDEQPPLQAFFDSRLQDLYGTVPQGGVRRNRRGRDLSVFGLLGGQPALRETLQMELIGGFAADPADRTVSITELSGVEIAEHPFEEMLRGRPVEIPPITREIPLDRFLLHVRSPESVLNWLENGSPWLQQVGALVTGNDLRYDLADRYSQALGMDAGFVRRFLLSGGVRELAIVLPDFFFVDGTDFTVLCELERGAVLDAMLSAIGVQEGEVRELQTADGGSCHWFLEGSRLVLASSRTELDLVLERRAGQGESLGNSMEFRCMLAELPPREETEVYAYFSDPFLRRLTGPEVKIGQLRRAREASRMQALAGAALLYRMDGHAGEPSVPRLIELKYLPESFRNTDLELNAKGRVRSPRWGALEQLRPLSADPVTMVTEAEAKMYGRYVDNYTRFWREFFDPIAVRLDRGADGLREVTTFILPLIDASIYDELREFLPTDPGQPLIFVPEFEDDPVMLASLQLGDAGMLEVVGEMANMFGGVQIDPVFWDLLSPQLHLAVWDDRPVLRSGSGDIMGAFSSAGFDDDMIGVAVAATLFTRPCDLCIEVQDPEAVRHALRGLTLDGRWDDWFEVNTYGFAGEDERVLSMSFGGIVQLDFSLRVEDDLLILSNHPFGERSPYVGRRPIDARGFVLEVAPHAVQRGLPAAFASLQEAKRDTVFRGMGRLLPFLWAGATSTDGAARQHRELFGFHPQFAGAATPIWQDAELRSPEYGTVHDPRQSRVPPNDTFGVLGGVHKLRVSAALENTGLRTKLRWTTKAGE